MGARTVRPGAVRNWLVAVLVAATGLAGPLVIGGSAPPAAAAVRPCSNGLVALTFDDGPSTTVTPKLLEVLSRHRVPATLFMVGERVASARSVALAAYKRGFVIANHTYRHEYLPSLSDAAVRATLRRTADALRSAGVRPSTLMRPPYGATSSRVDRVVEGMGLRSVLWDVDSRNWQPATAAGLTSRVVSALRPGRRNIVLLHDGVARSGTTLAAVPGIIRGARDRGYCFAALGPSGNPVPPVPQVRVSDAEVTETGPGTRAHLTFTLALDRPTSRAVSVRARTLDGTASAGTDYLRLEGRVEFPTGSTTRKVRIGVRGDRVDETRERLRLVLEQPRGLVVKTRSGTGTIVDDDPRPTVVLSDSTVTEPTTGSSLTEVGIAMDRPRSRRVVLVVGTRDVEADESDYVPLERTVVMPAGQRRSTVSVQVLADAVVETDETFEVRVLSVTGARVGDGIGTVRITPPVVEAPPRP